MRRRFALLTTALLAGASMSMAAAGPAHAQECQSDGDPVFTYLCTIINNAPEPGPTIDHYYYVVTGIAHNAYCKYVSPHC